jgi:hypothetical protein
MHSICIARYFFALFVPLIILYETYKLWSSSLCRSTFYIILWLSLSSVKFFNQHLQVMLFSWTDRSEFTYSLYQTTGRLQGIVHVRKTEATEEGSISSSLLHAMLRSDRQLSHTLFTVLPLTKKSRPLHLWQHYLIQNFFYISSHKQYRHISICC